MFQNDYLSQTCPKMFGLINFYHIVFVQYIYRKKQRPCPSYVFTENIVYRCVENCAPKSRKPRKFRFYCGATNSNSKNFIFFDKLKLELEHEKI